MILKWAKKVTEKILQIFQNIQTLLLNEETAIV